jgi:hypothetical protein
MGGLRDKGGVICGAITGVRRRTGREEGGGSERAGLQCT